MIGQTLGHYRIESKLGQGGMGVVYAARDLHLGRRVAIKVLPPAAVADPDRRRRFVQEAQAASMLNHPNILHIYDVEAIRSEDGSPADFIAMEYPNEREPAFIASADRMTASEKEWIAVTDRAASVSSPRWAPDGNLIYMVSMLDGFRCIWAQRLDPATKRPEGSPVPIYHSHSSRRSLLNVGLNLLEISVARDKIAFPLGEITGNLWTTTLEGAN